MDEHERQERARRARGAQAGLASRDVDVVAATFVDNSGITRVKAVPVPVLDHAAAWGIGASPVFDSFLFDGSGVTGPHAPGVVGDLRLHPDLDRLTVLAAQPGWAWAPVDRYDQQGGVHPIDQRSAARAAVAGLAAEGYEALAAFEVEWVVGLDPAPGADPDAFVSAARGPAYGHARVVERSDYVRDVVAALTAEDISVEQVHPEYAEGQFELSVAAKDPVGAADDMVLVRETVRAVSLRHGLRASFSPKVLAGGVGNGGHVHLSLWRDGRNTFAGGEGPCGLDEAGETFCAGVLAHLPGLLALGAPCMASYLRLVPQHWAGAFAVWGQENREAAVRLVPGPVAAQNRSANMEVKCFDLAANPYLAIAGLLFAGMAGLAEGTHLPAPVDVDPASLSEQERREGGVVRLPASLHEAVTAFEADRVLTRGLGEPLAATVGNVRRGEIARFADATPEDIVHALRWVY